jgi:hypothetical protein
MLNAVGKRLSLPLGDLLHAAQLGAASPRSAARGALAFQPSDRAWPGFAARGRSGPLRVTLASVPQSESASRWTRKKPDDPP